MDRSGCGSVDEVDAGKLEIPYFVGVSAAQVNICLHFGRRNAFFLARPTERRIAGRHSGNRNPHGADRPRNDRAGNRSRSGRWQSPYDETALLKPETGPQDAHLAPSPLIPYSFLHSFSCLHIGKTDRDKAVSGSICAAQPRKTHRALTGSVSGSTAPRIPAEPRMQLSGRPMKPVTVVRSIPLVRLMSACDDRD